MKHIHLTMILHRLTGLIRTRVILSLIGLYVMYKQPLIAQWVVSIIGLALGVSAIDAWKQRKEGNSNGE